MTMTDTRAPLQVAAAAALPYLMRTKRADGESTFTLAITAPDWVREMVREAHSGELPNDWRYKMIGEAVEAIAHPYDSGDISETEEIVNGYIDTNRARLAQWVADCPSRFYYVDSYLSECGGKTDAWDLLIGAQALAIAETVQIIHRALEHQAAADTL